MDDRFLQAVVISTFVCLSVALSTLYAPAAVLAVGLFTHKIHFLFFLLLPAAILFLWMHLRTLGILGAQRALDTDAAFALIVIYCLIVVLLTGGVSGSPLSSLVGIVPLLAGPIIDAGTRKRMLFLCVCGVIAVGVLSHLNFFTPPPEYPKANGWETSGTANNLIATSIMSFAILMEICLLAFRSPGQPNSKQVRA